MKRLFLAALLLISASAGAQIPDPTILKPIGVLDSRTTVTFACDTKKQMERVLGEYEANGKEGVQAVVDSFAAQTPGTRACGTVHLTSMVINEVYFETKGTKSSEERPYVFAQVTAVDLGVMRKRTYYVHLWNAVLARSI